MSGSPRYGRVVRADSLGVRNQIDTRDVTDRRTLRIYILAALNDCQASGRCPGSSVGCSRANLPAYGADTRCHEIEGNRHSEVGVVIGAEKVFSMPRLTNGENMVQTRRSHISASDTAKVTIKLIARPSSQSERRFDGVSTKSPLLNSWLTNQVIHPQLKQYFI